MERPSRTAPDSEPNRPIRKNHIDPERKAPRKHPLRELEQAPLIQKKILLSHPTTIYPDRVSMLKQTGGRVERHIPAQFHVIAEDGRVHGYRIATSKGEEVGWIRLDESAKNANEWSTQFVWRPKSNKKPQFFRSVEEGKKNNNPISLPDSLYDPDHLFPVLQHDSETGMIQIGRPFPRTVETDVDFPLWVEKWKTEWSSQEAHILLEQKKLEGLSNELTFLINRWKKWSRDTWSMDKTLKLYTATQIALGKMMIGNSFRRENDVELSTDMTKTGDYLSMYDSNLNFAHYLEAGVDDIYDFNPEMHPLMLKKLEHFLLNIEDAKKTTNTYSLYKDGKRLKYVPVALY